MHRQEKIIIAPNNKQSTSLYPNRDAVEEALRKITGNNENSTVGMPTLTLAQAWATVSEALSFIKNYQLIVNNLKGINPYSEGGPSSEQIDHLDVHLEKRLELSNYVLSIVHALWLLTEEGSAHPISNGISIDYRDKHLQSLLIKLEVFSEQLFGTNLPNRLQGVDGRELLTQTLLNTLEVYIYDVSREKFHADNRAMYLEEIGELSEKIASMKKDRLLGKGLITIMLIMLLCLPPYMLPQRLVHLVDQLIGDSNVQESDTPEGEPETSNQSPRIVEEGGKIFIEG